MRENYKHLIKKNRFHDNDSDFDHRVVWNHGAWRLCRWSPVSAVGDKYCIRLI